MGPTYLDTCLAEVDTPGQLLTHKGVRVVCALEHSLQGLELAAVERGSVPSLLLLSFGGMATARAGTVT